MIFSNTRKNILEKLDETERHLQEAMFLTTILKNKLRAEKNGYLKPEDCLTAREVRSSLIDITQVMQFAHENKSNAELQLHTLFQEENYYSK